MMLPLLSPVRTSPFWLKATQVTYLGLSLPSKMPIRLYSIPPLSKDQNDTCPFPQETIWFRSNGCHSAQTTVSTEHCNRQSLAVKWPASGQNIRESRLLAILRIGPYMYMCCENFLSRCYTCVSNSCVFVAYLRFRHFGATVALLPVPNRYIVIGGLVDGA